MRNQPSNQSRDNNSTWRSKSPSRQAGCFCLDTEVDQRSSSSIRTSQTPNASKESHFKYVPSQRSNQKQSFTRNADTYEKPCLPYYVVPVLYVPQKVLSSEEIRATSSANKNTMSFVLKEKKESKERSMINVDEIPCIPCELAKKSKQNKDGYNKEETLINDVNLDASCTGYINTGYTQSSTSLIDDTIYQEEAIPNRTTQRGSPLNVHFQNKYYRRENEPNQRQDRLVRQTIPQQWQRFPNTQQNRYESYQLPKSNVRVRWNPECNCYEAVEEIIVSNEVTQVYQGDDNRRMYPRNRNLIPTCEPQRVRTAKQTNVLQQRRYQQACYRNDQNYMDEQRCRDPEAERSYQMQLPPQGVRYQDSVDQTRYDDNYDQENGVGEQTSSLSCEKAPKVLKKVSSLIDGQYTCEQGQEEGMASFSQNIGTHPPHAEETFTIVPLDLGEDSILSVALRNGKSKRRKKPKESQTAFDENIDSTYVATDEPLRETKSTQTVDAATRSVTTSTQTNRALRTFETCPPPFIEQIGEQVGVTARPRTREASPSPVVRLLYLLFLTIQDFTFAWFLQRYRRAPSPVKQYPGDAKKMTIMKTAEILQKPVTNQVSSTCPIRQQKIKRRKPRTSLSPG